MRDPRPAGYLAGAPHLMEDDVAGKALLKQILLELDRRASVEGHGSGPDYVREWVAGGGTVLTLAEDLGCSRTYLSRHLNAKPEYREALQEARREVADALAEEALQIADGMASVDGITREQVAVAKERIDVRKWLAAVNNPDRFQINKQGPQVVLNVNNLHLEALKRRNVVMPGDDAKVIGGSDE